MLSLRTIVAALCIGAVAACAFFVANHSYLFERFDTVKHGHIVVNRDFFNDYYRDYSGTSTVAYGLALSSGLSRTSFHSIGHTIGEVLYEREGKKALVTCADSFEWGCIHQVVGRLFTEKGNQSLSELKMICSQYALPNEREQCEHGVGHGVAFAYAYDHSKVNDMLRECDSVSVTRPISRNNSCHAGLFMELNNYYMTMEYEGFNGRPVPEDPFELCRKVSTRYLQNICTYWMEPWVHGRVYDFVYTLEVFQKLGALCRSAEGPLRKGCFEGVGRSVGVNAKFAPEYVIRLCEAASPSLEEQNICIRRAANMYRSVSKQKDYEAICASAERVAGRSCR